MRSKIHDLAFAIACSALLVVGACGGEAPLDDDPTSFADTDLAALEAAGEGDRAVSEDGDATTDADAALPEECAEGCNGRGYWEGENRTTTGAVQQGAPVQVGASTYSGGMSFRAAITNPTQSPAVHTPSSSTCTTTSGSVTFSSSNTLTMTGGITIGGLSLGGSGTSVTSSGTTQTVTTCTTVGSSTQYTLQPGETLYCTDFDGLARSEWDVPRFRIDSTYYWARYCRKCTSTVIHLCGGVICGPWQQGTGTTTRVDLDPIHVVLEVPISGTKCSTTSHPMSPF